MPRRRPTAASFSGAVPKLRDLARAMALRFPSVDVAPMSSPGGQISPPGSRHKSGGWRAFAGPLQAARAAAGQPSGPEVWNALLAEFAAELRQAESGGRAADLDVAELDDTGVPWMPRAAAFPSAPSSSTSPVRGGGTGSRYPGRSEARMAVLAAAAARGWQLADVRAAASGAWRGRARLYERRSEPARMHRLLPYECRKAVDLAGGRKTCANGTLATLDHAPPAGRTGGADEYGLIRGAGKNTASSEPPACLLC